MVLRVYKETYTGYNHVTVAWQEKICRAYRDRNGRKSKKICGYNKPHEVTWNRWTHAGINQWAIEARKDYINNISGGKSLKKKNSTQLEI